ncbi:MAG: hypothetical protein OEM05_04885 [Myxococcales bacterium]|nr:hypothetical protein [Myxococcales bacterium]
MHKRFSLAGLAILALAFSASSADAGTIDFEDGFSHGEIVTSASGVVIITENFDENFGDPNSDADWGVIFNSSLMGTSDPGTAIRASYSETTVRTASIRSTPRI